MKWISRSFNISNFISSHSQVFGRIDVPKKLRKIHVKALVLECTFNKVAGPQSPDWNFNSEKDTSTGVFLWLSWNFWEYLYYRTAPRDWVRNFNIVKHDFPFIMHFSPTVVTFQRVYQVQWIWYRWKTSAK